MSKGGRDFPADGALMLGLLSEISLNSRKYLSCLPGGKSGSKEVL